MNKRRRTRTHSCRPRTHARPTHLPPSHGLANDPLPRLGQRAHKRGWCARTGPAACRARVPHAAGIEILILHCFLPVGGQDPSAPEAKLRSGQPLVPQETLPRPQPQARLPTQESKHKDQAMDPMEKRKAAMLRFTERLKNEPCVIKARQRAKEEKSASGVGPGGLRHHPSAKDMVAYTAAKRKAMVKARVRDMAKKDLNVRTCPCCGPGPVIQRRAALHSDYLGD